jgi:four helix bundle protein
MAAENTHRALSLWQKAVDLAVLVRELAAKLPPHERFVLSAQMRRAAYSIPCNVAEGYGRQSRADYCRFLAIARGSARELDTQFEIASRCALLSDDQLAAARGLLDEITRMLTSTIRRLQSR